MSSSGQAHLLGARQAAAAGARGRAPAFDDPVGPAGHGQDHARAPVRRDRAMREFVALSAVLAGVKDIRAAVERAQRAREQRAARPCCSSTKCTASTRRSRTLPAVRRGRHAGLHRRHDREPVVRGRSARCCRARGSTCCKPLTRGGSRSAAASARSRMRSAASARGICARAGRARAARARPRTATRGAR